MLPTQKKYLQLTTLILTIVIASSQISSGSTALGLQDKPVVLQKPGKFITDIARDFLVERDGDMLKVWVFFTDKEITTRAGFNAMASTISLTERAMKRRAKVGKDKIVFADIPVSENYINKVVALGGKLRHASRWLNAASFEIPSNALQQIGMLEFVTIVKPLSIYGKVTPVDVSDIRYSPGNVGQAPDALIYGGSQTQLQQINVPQVHAKGFTGQGVTLAIMDTGFRKSHEAFALAWSENRVLAEWDFVFGDGNTANEAGDWSSQWNHGTYIWSVSGGQKDGSIYGPAYKANFILCKTEDARSETPVEEDNWVAALQFADSIGVDVTTTSLGYSDWYTFADYDGLTATITIAANTADSLGIVLCNSMGNGGPGSGTLTPPADAFNILAVGAVNNLGNIASFSSRGPTADGRMKPEVCAMGVSTYAASSSSDNSYTGVSGTSLSTPLIAGAVCLLIEARPTFPPALIRQALKETASRSSNPDNSYGYGIIDLEAALRWGGDFIADTLIGDAPLSVQFTSVSTLSPTSFLWDFGDGNNSTLSDPSHLYATPGSYTVSLTLQTSYGPITTTKQNFIAVMGDTLTFVGDSVFAGSTIDISVNLQNSQPLNKIVIPFDLPDSILPITLDSVLLGSRTSYFEQVNFLSNDPGQEKYTIELKADNGGGSPPLPPGNGEVMILRVRTDRLTFGGLADTITSSEVSQFTAELFSDQMTYSPSIIPGIAATKGILRCDVDYSNDGVRDIGDLTALISYLFMLSYTPVTLQSSDCNASFGTDISDVNYMIAYLFMGGPPPPQP